jgi:hypothetical protein
MHPFTKPTYHRSWHGRRDEGRAEDPLYTTTFLSRDYSWVRWDIITLEMKWSDKQAKAIMKGPYVTTKALIPYPKARRPFYPNQPLYAPYSLHLELAKAPLLNQTLNDKNFLLKKHRIIYFISLSSILWFCNILKSLKNQTLPGVPLSPLRTFGF